MSDRRLGGEHGGDATLFDAAARFPLADTRAIELPARPPERAKRTAILQLRFGEVEICRPRDEQDHGLAATVRLRLIELEEVAAPAGVEPLHWRLLTTHAVEDVRPGLAHRRLVPGPLGDRAVVPGDEVAGTATGGQPARLG